MSKRDLIFDISYLTLIGNWKFGFCHFMDITF